MLGLATPGRLSLTWYGNGWFVPLTVVVWGRCVTQAAVSWLP